MSYLLDTMVLSEPARPAPDSRVIDWLRAQSPLDLSISALTLGELAKGIALLSRGRRRDTLERWLQSDLPRQFSGRVLSIDDAIAREWGKLSADGQRSGRPLPVIDGLLLATAVVHRLTLVTRNERDCAGRGIPIHNPWPS
ncbi:MAG TPA: type II toxin-antitoxin system VapC family toxin [Gemmatimonadaceae bacterium]|jgi:predicted nucleic acid-binding protein|nr:type II toxin-antitoxin system VapC family toxin [Gemmatimonadaceae bacterium]